jgi:enoyl-CoA hydratase
MGGTVATVGDEPVRLAQAHRHRHGHAAWDTRFRSVIEVDKAGAGLTVVTIDLPAAHPQLEGDDAALLYEAFLAFEADPEAKVAVLAGTSAAFCVGTVGRLLPLRPAGPAGPTRLQLSKPVIAAIEGLCLGVGLELALWCDLRVAGLDATFGFSGRAEGVPMADGGGIRLARIVGQGRALDLILTGRRLDAEKASRIGLVDRVSRNGNARATALTLAAEIAGHPWPAVVADRRCVLEGADLELDQALAHQDAIAREVLAEGGVIGDDQRRLSPVPGT